MLLKTPEPKAHATRQYQDKPRIQKIANIGGQGKVYHIQYLDTIPIKKPIHQKILDTSQIFLLIKPLNNFSHTDTT